MHLPAHNRTLVFLCGYPFQLEYSHFIQELQQSRDLIGHPLLVPLCLISAYVEDSDDMTSECRLELNKIHFEAGMNHKDDLEEHELIAITRKLTRLTLRLTDSELFCETNLMLLDRLDAEDRAMTALVEDKVRHMRSALQIRYEHLREITRANLSIAKCLSRQREAYIQMVSGPWPHVYGDAGSHS